jgi:CPA1 family monovalent cation:H+ antiporter
LRTTSARIGRRCATRRQARTREAKAVRHQFQAHLASQEQGDDSLGENAIRREMHRGAINAARRAALEMRAGNEIGDDAFHGLEEELDRLEISVGAEPA